ncbi:Uncharacterized protein HZ326_9969 [Fusarium oxysporum f. sp. albedinis]|nr:Uncharacterized protein HZ326_9969 [Fusarium oxysporum f. sp. albedinis]
MASACHATYTAFQTRQCLEYQHHYKCKNRDEGADVVDLLQNAPNETLLLTQVWSFVSSDDPPKSTE